MKQITQKDLINLIEEKQENAKNAFEALQREQCKEMKIGQNHILDKERNKAYIDCYQDLICYINSVEIVPEKKPLDNVLQKTMPIMPRFREFNDDVAKYFIDAKKITTIAYIAQHNNIEIGIENNNTLVFDGSQKDYNEVCDWWKYWNKGE